MLGHSYTALLASPQFACPTNNIKVDGLRGKDVFCVGNEDMYTLLTDILEEVLTLFPSKYIYIGAVEVYKKSWQECPICQKNKLELGLSNEDQLQSSFVKRIEKYLNRNGRNLLGWDDILQGGLSTNAAIMVWRDVKFAREAVLQKRPVIMSPGTHCYFEMSQGKQRTEPKAQGGFISVEKVYKFEPIPIGFSEDEAKFVLGGQANVWTEHIQTLSHVEYMIFRRFTALAERLWSQKNADDWHCFSNRVRTHEKRWKVEGINFRPLN